jgi:hypothetical protein
MNSLEEAWRWYEKTKQQLRLVERLAGKYWGSLPWDGSLGRDDHFRDVEESDLLESVHFTLDELDDLAVLVLFSAFESMVRIRVLAEVKSEEGAIRHSVLIEAVQDAIERIEEGSFFWVLKPFKNLDHGLVEEVNKVRHYRNWVAHGRRGAKPSTVEPKTAYARLSRFWRLLDESSARVV